MGRRKGELTLLMEIASKWPWKVSAALVPISHVVCHLIAAAVNPPASITDLSDMGSVVIRGHIHTFAVIFQYIFPMIFLVTALVSFVRRSLHQLQERPRFRRAGWLAIQYRRHHR